MRPRWPVPASGPWPEVALAVAVSGLLLAFIGADPTRGVTASASPFTDEAWNVLNARNLALLGRWSTDQFNLDLVNGPFSLVEAGIFSVLGVGMVQARLLSAVWIGLTTLTLAVGLRRPLGRGPALLAAATFGTCFLVLFYGRLAYTEPLVIASLTAGVLLLVHAADGSGSGRRAVVAGVLLGIAIATKANALFAVVGVGAAIALVEPRSRAVRRTLAGALLGLAAVAVVWLLVVFIPNREAVLVDLRIWPQQSLPSSIGELIRRVGAYPFRTDGALPGLLPLAAGAGLGTVLTVIGRRTLSPMTRRLAVAAIGWLAFELVVLFLVPYRPNRYLLPALPAAAILVGVAWHLLAEREQHSLGRRAGLRTALIAGAIVALTVPGLVAYAGWMTRATYDLAPMQAMVAAILPPGEIVWGGYAPLVAMRAPVTTIVPWSAAAANVGPAYRRLPVRWVVDGNHPPGWIVPRAAAWAGRQRRACFDWNAAPVCLYELPR